MKIVAINMPGTFKILTLSLLVSLCANHVFGNPARRAEILSRLQIMSEGTYSAAEWHQVNNDLDGILQQAQQQGEWDEYVEIRVIQAKVLAARGDRAGAMQLMRVTLSAFRDKDVKSMKKVYHEIAALHARDGNERGVTEIMNEFKKSRHYDSQVYDFSGGAGPGDPIVVTRPGAGADASISVTAMKVQQARARTAPGQLFPGFSAVSWDGRAVNNSWLSGTVTLIDFWAPGMTIWRRELHDLQAFHQRYQAEGFTIIGFSIDPNEQRARTFANQNGLRWTLATAPRSLTAELGIFGDASNYLIDRNGVIIGRNLRGADLDSAIRTALRR